MTRFWLWILLTFIACVATWFGMMTFHTFAAGSYFSGGALFLHSLFGEEA